ncbi:CAP domain-containing protein [Modestobacter sp. I12A-02662]|uniref:CAP domain-containing protein n=1 Tax=Modestobacter sp. I12A-02662 TaxID=1730496 RepID=UPI0034E04163
MTTSADAWPLSGQLGLQLDASEQWVADNINAYRAQYGLAPLTISEQLRRPTMWGSLDSATRTDGASPVDHTHSRGMGIAQRADLCGGHTGLIGEIEYGGEGGTADNPCYYGSGPAALEAWKNSPPHNALMLRGDFTTFGVGFAYLGVNAESGSWTVMFGDH